MFVFLFTFKLRSVRINAVKNKKNSYRTDHRTASPIRSSPISVLLKIGPRTSSRTEPQSDGLDRTI